MAEDSPDARMDMSRIIRLFSGFVTVGGKIGKALRHSAARLFVKQFQHKGRAVCARFGANTIEVIPAPEGEEMR
ncbi:MAG TPA: hypothetical protein VN284_08180 [Rhizobium sp.]|nr:hypothetical protein [Rhizobium sp.]